MFKRPFEALINPTVRDQEASPTHLPQDGGLRPGGYEADLQSVSQGVVVKLSLRAQGTDTSPLFISLCAGFSLSLSFSHTYGHGHTHCPSVSYHPHIWNKLFFGEGRIPASSRRSPPSPPPQVAPRTCDPDCTGPRQWYPGGRL